MKPPRLGALGAFLSISLACPLAAQAVDGDPPDLSNWPHPRSSVGNPFPRSTATPAEIALRDTRVRLGKALFWDEQVSTDNTVSCGTCHLTELGGTDGRLGQIFSSPGSVNDGNDGAAGVVPQRLNGGAPALYGITGSNAVARRVTPVHTPTMIGAYLFRFQFWDRRAGPLFKDEAGVNIPNFDFSSLENQAVGPPINDTEMGHNGITWGSGFLQQKLNMSRPLALVDPATVPPDILPLVTSGSTYATLFDDAYATHPQFGGNVGVTRERFAMAIAHYERTLIPDQAPIDLGTMTASQIAGFNIMKNNASCFICHSLSQNPTLDANNKLTLPEDNLFSDGLIIHDINLTPATPNRKTPTLRNLGLHRKFFSTGHGGDGVTKIRVTNLDELITFYDNQPPGPPINLGFNGTLSATARAQVRDFLENALTDPRVASAQFPFDRPQLASERAEFSPFEVNEIGVGRKGGTPHVPDIIANALPHVSAVAGAPSWFKIGVGGAAPSVPCFLLISAGLAGPGALPRIIANPTTMVFGGQTDTDGFATAVTPFPLTPASLGIPVFAQWQLLANHLMSWSDAAKFTPFQF